jgi:hypothetical protein
MPAPGSVHADLIGAQAMVQRATNDITFVLTRESETSTHLRLRRLTCGVEIVAACPRPNQDKPTTYTEQPF